MSTLQHSPGSGRIPSSATRTQTDVIRMCLHGKSANTVEAYTRDVERFLALTGCLLRDLRLEDLQAFADSLKGLAASTKARKLAAVKSLLTFAHEIGYVPFNVGKPVKLPKTKNTLSERILSESQVQQIIASETSGRNRSMLRLSTPRAFAPVRSSDCAGVTLPSETRPGRSPSTGKARRRATFCFRKRRGVSSCVCEAMLPAPIRSS